MKKNRNSFYKFQLEASGYNKEKDLANCEIKKHTLFNCIS